MLHNFLTVILCLGLLPDLFAAGPSPAVTLSGIVTDPTGSIVVGASVTLKLGSVELAATKTDYTGHFLVNGAELGEEYTVIVEHPGFSVATLIVHIDTQHPPLLSVRLNLATIESRIDVASQASSVSDPSSNQDAIRLTAQVLSGLPILDENYVATLANLLDQASFGTTGSPTVSVNGMEVQQVAVSQSAVQEVRIGQDPYSAEYWLPGRGKIEITTKFGAKQLSGAVGFLFRDALFDARNPLASSQPPEQHRIYDLFLNGPIRKQRDAFLFSFTRDENDLQSPVYAVVPSGLVRANVPNPAHLTKFSVRLTHESSKRHGISLQYDFFDYLDEGSGVGGVVLSGAGTNNSIEMNHLTFSDQFILSATQVNQLQVRLGSYTMATDSTLQSPKIVVEGAFTGGGAQAARTDMQYTVSLNEIFSWTAGRWQGKLGVNVPTLSCNTLNDASNFGGTFYFSGIPAYIARQPFLLRWQAGSHQIRFSYDEMAAFAQEQVRLNARLSLTVGFRYNWQSYFPAATDFAPRASAAYALDRKSRSILRVGSGVFYDRTGWLPVADVIRYNGVLLRQYSETNPIFSANLPVTSGVLPPDVFVLAPNVRMPYYVQFSSGFEHQLDRRATISLTYRGSRGFHLFRSLDINAPRPPTYLARPDPSFGIVQQIQSVGRQRSDALDVTFHGTVGPYFNGQAQYTLSSTRNDTSGISYFPSNQYDLHGEWARADSDQRHHFNLMGTAKVRDWFTVGALFMASSGKPYTVTTGTDRYNDGMDNARPPGTPRNSAEGRSYAALDLRLSHDFFVASKDRKGPALTAAVEAFNILNHGNYLTYMGVAKSSLFGQPLSAYPGRRLQMTVRFRF